MILQLTRGYTTEIDDADFERQFTYWLPDDTATVLTVAELKWSVFTPYHTRYARAGVGSSRSGSRKWILLHRLLTEAPLGMIADHRDRNGLNNQRHNLRVVTHRESRLNTRKQSATNRYRGVYWIKKDKRWGCRITDNGKTRWLGSFADEIAAARAYDEAAHLLHGGFAMPNFP